MVAEKEREPEEGEAQKSPSTIVAESLSHISRSSTFLLNIGVPRLSKTGQASSIAAQARLQAEFEARLQLKEMKLLGSRKNCKHSFKLSRPHSKKTKVCCARLKRKWTGWIPSLKRLMHYCELSSNFRKIEVGMNAVSQDEAFAYVIAT